MAVPVHVDALAGGLKASLSEREQQGDPATATQQGEPVKPDIHPQYIETSVVCSCGASFTTRSTAKSGKIHADVCSACHPFYTGKQKILDIGGRVEKFEKRFGKAAAK
jgi:large subunit ribosomal protein L31